MTSPGTAGDAPSAGLLKEGGFANSRMMQGKLNRLLERLQEGEEIRVLAMGRQGGAGAWMVPLLNLALGRFSIGVLAITDRRFIFFEKSMGREVLQDIFFANITAIESRQYIQGRIEVRSLGRTIACSEIRPRDMADKLADRLRREIAAIAAAPPPRSSAD
jgi:hypothetical protein